MANLNKPLAVEDYDAIQLGLDQNRHATFLVSTKVKTASEKGLQCTCRWSITMLHGTS